MGYWIDDVYIEDEGEVTNYNWSLSQLSGTLTTGTNSLSSISSKNVYRKKVSISSSGTHSFTFNGSHILWIWITTTSYGQAYVSNQKIPVPSNNVITSNYTEDSGNTGEIVIGEDGEIVGGSPSGSYVLSDNLDAGTYYLYFCFTDYASSINTSLDLTIIKEGSSSSGDGDITIEEPDVPTTYNWSIYTGVSIAGSGSKSYTLYPTRIYRSQFTISTSGTFSVSCSSGGTSLLLWISSSSSCYNSNQQNPIPSSGVLAHNVDEIVVGPDGELVGTGGNSVSTYLSTGTYYFYSCISNYSGNSTNVTYSISVPSNIPDEIIIDESGNIITNTDNPAYSDTYPQENLGSTPTPITSDGFTTSSSSSEPTESNFTITNDNSLFINPTLINSLIDAWNSICESRQYYGNLNSLVGNISKISTNSLTHNTQINTLINTYQKYFNDANNITIVNSSSKIYKNKLTDFKSILQNKNRSCKEACTGFCSTTNSNRTVTQTCAGYCSGGCTSGCYGCEGTCSNWCVGCTGECSYACIHVCQESCSGECGSTCEGSAEGQQGAQNSYTENPTSSTNCTTCANTCVAQCQLDCNDYCVHLCATGCYQSCNVFCNSICSDSCYTDCGVTCAYGFSAQCPSGPRAPSLSEPTSCGSSCNSICGTWCGGHCNDTCMNACGHGSACAGICLGTCSDACENACQNFCGDGCTSGCRQQNATTAGSSSACSCSGYCTGGCLGSCGNGNCTGECLSACGLNCTGNCSDGCKDGCERGCKNSIKGHTESSFTSSCGKNACTQNCQTGCSSGCSSGSKGSTTAACNNGCVANCATSCSSWCVTSSS